MLAAEDNVFVLRKDIPAGENVLIDGVAVIFPSTIPRDHKLARRAISPSGKIILYAALIGSATAQIGCANPDTFRRMEDNMGIHTGRILETRDTLDGVGAEIVAATRAVASPHRTKSEAMGHQDSP